LEFWRIVPPKPPSLYGREVFKREKVWYFRCTNADGGRVMRKGCTDRRATEEMARAAETEAAKVRSGLIDPKDMVFRAREARPLLEHLADWKAFLLGKERSERHANEGHARRVKLMALAKATRLSDLTLARLQTALAQ
jgi:hypothetical protein